jgi:hypothetical protein
MSPKSDHFHRTTRHRSFFSLSCSAGSDSFLDFFGLGDGAEARKPFRNLAGDVTSRVSSLEQLPGRAISWMARSDRR